MISPSIFYSRYVSNINKKAALEQRFPLRGKSPFGDGFIELFDNGSFHCKVTGKQGTASDFLKTLYPLLTDSGVKQAISFESDFQSELHLETIEGHLSQFRSSQTDIKLISEDFGIPIPTLKELPFWTNPDGSILSMIQKNSTGQPICSINWWTGQREENISGIPRVQKVPQANQIWFTENKLVAEALHRKINEPVYLRPSHRMLNWNDYCSLTKNKRVIILSERERGDWEYSFFPFLQKLREWDHEVRVIYTEHLTDSNPLMSWLQKKENLNKLLEKIQKPEDKDPKIYDKRTYHEFISRDKVQNMYAPQDLANGRFWYKLGSGEFVHSWPINVCNSSEMLSKFNINVNDDKDHEIRLSKDQVLNITVSSSQLTPFQTYKRLKSFIEKYIYLEHREIISLITIWIMGGYVYQLFPAYAYIHLLGGKGTGKTTLLELVTILGFNGIMESQSTRAKVVEQVHRLGCTLSLDEFESSSIGTGDQYTQMLKGGYKKGGAYSKMAGKGKETRLNTYSPKVLASIDPIGDEALASRTIPVRTTIMPASTSRSDWNGDDHKIINHAQSIRLGCYALGLYHHKTILKYLRQVPDKITLDSGSSLSTRKRQIAAPLVAIAQLIDTNKESNVERELLRAFEISWNQQKTQQVKHEKMLADVLSQWNEDEGFESYKYKNEMTWIDNACWEDTPLFNDFGGQTNLLNWFSELSGVEKNTVYLNSRLGSKSCTGFPNDLKVHKKTVREIFSRK